MSDAYLEDLARSGLTKKDAALMGIRAVASATVKKISKGLYESDAYQIPYFDTKGKPADFFRLRFNPAVLDKRTGKTIRYWQPPRTPPRIYFAPHMDWGRVLKNPDEPIIITEGEKKAASGCKLLKKPVVGLGGVWSWGSKRDGTVVLPELVPFLKDRDVLICFDHEPVPNPDVTMALHQIARAARSFGARPLMLPLPSVRDGEKAGLDDILVELGVKAFLEIQPQGLEDEAQLEELNKDLAYIEKSGALYHIPTAALYDKPQRLTSVIYSSRTIIRYDAKGNAVEKNLAGEWCRWPRRRTHSELAYEPGKPNILEDGRLNVWKGWGLEPKRGGIGPWLKLMDHIFADADDATRKWFIQWLAYPLQHPGTKLYTGVLMFSILHGVGKSLLGETMRRIYGENFVSIKAEELHSSFNEWAKHRQFILGDEVTGRERREDGDRLKNLITQEFVTINSKYQVPYRLPDKANVYLTTNHPDAMSLEPNDRRTFVHEIKRQTLPVDWYTKIFDPWYRDEKNSAALFYYLLHDVDLKSFDPKADAPRTEAKEEMQSLSGGQVDFHVRDFVNAPERFLIGHTRDLYMALELAAIIDPSGRTGHSAVAKALRRLGVHPVHNKTRTHRGVVTLFPVRNADKWRNATPKQRADHYDGLKQETKK